MSERTKRLPSPTAAIAIVALIVAVGGGTFAVASSHHGPNLKTVKRIAKSVANKQITKRANGLSVSHAASADSATTAASLAPPEAVHLVGAPGEPAFVNGAENFNAEYTPAGFYRDRECVVHLQGTIHAESGLGVFRLPEGDRPAKTVVAAIGVAGPEAGNLVVKSSGAVTPADQGGIANDFGLDGVTFRAAGC